MRSVPVPSSSVEGIKRLATTLKREHSIPHRQALEEAAHIVVSRICATRSTYLMVGLARSRLGLQTS